MRTRKLSRSQRARMSYLIHTLSDLSRDGWARSTAADWQPLERELSALYALEGRA